MQRTGGGPVSMHRRRRKRPRTTAPAGASSSSLLENRPHQVANYYYSNNNHKTSLPQPQQRPKKPTSSLSASFLEDSDYSFADGLKVTPTDIPPRACLPVFLEERRSGLWKKTSQKIATWQRRMLLHRDNATSNFSSSSSMMILKRTWRPYASRRIPFTRVGTPETEAVLALDRTATQMLSLGGGGDSFSSDDDDDNNHLALTLRLYGVPSPSAVRARKGCFGKAATTPLLMTIPLMMRPILPTNDHENNDNDDLNVHVRRTTAMIISPTNTPVQVLVSNDWKLGVALVLPTTATTIQDPSWNDDDDGPTGTVVVFGLHHDDDDSRKRRRYQAINVRIASGEAFTSRNLLWRVQQLPILSHSTKGDDNNNNHTKAIQGSTHVPGYLFLNDEADGYRLTWVMESQWDASSASGERPEEEDLLPAFVGDEDEASASGIECPEAMSFQEETWQECYSDKITGREVYGDPQQSSSTSGDDGGIQIVAEVFLGVEGLLGKILSRRKKFASSQLQDYQYNCVSVSPSGRIAELVITFLLKEKAASLGLFVHVDLYTGTFQEKTWIKSNNVHASATNKSSAPGSSTLRDWCNSLALNRRAQTLQAGPFSIQGNKSMGWNRLYTDQAYFDQDEADNFDSSIWQPHFDNAFLSEKPPKLISLSTLYPDCDWITNKAVISKTPVHSLTCKDSPIQLVYG